MDLNKVMLIGRLTRDPETRTTPGGINVCQVSIATSYVYTNQQTGQKVEQTEFHNVVLWRKLGEIAQQYLKKGSQVFLEGRLQTRSWDDKNSGQKRYRTEIVAENMIMLGRPNTSTATTDNTAPGPAASKAANDFMQASPANASTPASAETEELPTINQDEDINVEDIPF